MRHDQSSINKIQKVLDSCQGFCEGMKNEHLSSVQKKVTELLTADDLVVTCITSFKQNIISHQAIEFRKCLTAVGVFCGWMKNEHLSSVQKKATELLTADDLVVTCKSSLK